MNPELLKKIRRFSLWFVLIYGPLLVPWPGVDEVYGAWFRAVGRAVFCSEEGQRELAFHKGGFRHAMTITRIEIVNRSLMARDGSGPVRNLDMDTGGFRRATALMVALALTIPIAWRRRVRALIWGCLGIQGFILLTVAFAIWNESRYVGLTSLSSFWEGAADNVQHALVDQFSVAVPVLVLILVAFRREDVEFFLQRTNERNVAQ